MKSKLLYAAVFVAAILLIRSLPFRVNAGVYLASTFYAIHKLAMFVLKLQREYTF